jgi:hypothetical protein
MVALRLQEFAIVAELARYQLKRVEVKSSTNPSQIIVFVWLLRGIALWAMGMFSVINIYIID